MNKKILVISVCKEKLHELEFVKPIEDILRSSREDFFTKNYLDLSKNDLENVSKVIICGTSLQDFGYVQNIEKFEWIKDFNKPVIGICAGMQILYLIFKEKKSVRLKEQMEIGSHKVFLKKNFFGRNEKIDAYFLHNIGVKKNSIFEVIGYSATGIAVIKHREKPVYGVLFHPEVRNKNIIQEFIKNG